MARITNPLTNTEVKQAKPRSKEYNLADGNGLQLRVKPNGNKLWLFNYYRPFSRKRANLSMGVYPAVSLAEAREKAKGYRELLAQDIDPKLEKEREKQEKAKLAANTLEVVSRQWFDLKSKKVTGNYADDIIRSLENHVFPKLGNYPLSEITAPKVITVLKPLSNAGKLEMIKRIASRLNQIMTYATNTGLIHNNPLAGVRHAFENPTVTNNPTLRPDELPELMEALSEASIRKITRYLIQWQLHTMTRPGEAAGARWDEIDEEAGVWAIPPERMKKRREHVIPLTDEVMALLEKIRPISGKSQYLFPGDVDPKKPANSSTANVALKRMGFKGRLTAHGMRSIASTTLNEQGFDSELVEVSLAHIDKNTTRAAYNKADYLERRRVMMDWWSERVVLAAKGELSSKPSRKVLRLVG